MTNPTDLTITVVALHRAADRLEAAADRIQAAVTASATTASVAPALVSIIQAAEALGISKGKAYQLVGNGRLRTVKIGSRRLVPVGAISDLVAELEAGDHA